MSTFMWNIKDWLAENSKYFKPPICNKLMYKDGQLKVFFVGGPNQRKDFHLEEGEELFYMFKGDMNLIVFEKGRFRNIVIKEGEIFLLPGRKPHSPQRFQDTIGLVIERERSHDELDCLRYYVDNSYEILYEKFFRCENLEELGPLIREFFESQAYKTGKPLSGSVLQDKPIKEDFSRSLGDPINLQEWLNSNRDCIDKEGKKMLFEGNYVSRVHVLGKGTHIPENDLPEVFFWQIVGTSEMEVDGKIQTFEEGHTMLVPANRKYVVRNPAGGRILAVAMNPLSKKQ